MIVATYNIHQTEPRILSAGHGPSRWLVNLWISGIPVEPTPGADADAPEKEVASLPSGCRCLLSDMLETAASEIEAMMNQFREIHDGGFTVVRLR